MRITFLSPPPNLSGGERVIAIYSRELSRLGHKVHVLCNRPHVDSWWGRVRKLAKGRGWRFNPWTANTHYNNYGINYTIASHDLDSPDADAPDADVVIATYWSTAHCVQRLPPEKGEKFYLVQHDEGDLFPWFPAEETYGFPMLHIYVSNWISDRIRLRHPNVNGIVINNAVDVEDFDRGERNKPSAFRIGMMWAGDPAKGGDIAIRAVKIARKRGNKMQLVGFGTEKPKREHYSSFDEYIVCPKPAMLADLYSTCSAWLFTSRFEGFGLPILEAMAARTPVIGTPTGAAPELIAQGGGIQIPIEDPIGTANAIEQIAYLDALAWKELSEAAYRTARAHSWRNATKSLEQFLLSHLDR